MATQRGPRITDLNGLGKFLAKVLRETYTDKMTESKGRTLAYIGSVLKGVLEASEVEIRVGHLEDQVSDLADAKARLRTKLNGTGL